MKYLKMEKINQRSINNIEYDVVFSMKIHSKTYVNFFMLENPYFILKVFNSKR